MANPLDGAIAKVDRAYKNVDDLHTRITAFLDEAEFPITFKGRPDPHTTVFSSGRTRVPDDIAVMIGEVAHNLRSALDHAFFALATAHVMATKNRLFTPDEEKSLQFPACRHAKDYPGVRKGKIVPWVPVAALALIDGLQPCNNPGPADDYFTAIVTDLNNRDKHRLLVVAIAELDTPPAVYGRILEQLNAGIVLPVDMEVHRERPSDVQFPQLGTRKHESVLPSLVQLTQAVERAVKLFAPVF